MLPYDRFCIGTGTLPYDRFCTGTMPHPTATHLSAGMPSPRPPPLPHLIAGMPTVTSISASSMAPRSNAWFQGKCRRVYQYSKRRRDVFGNALFTYTLDETPAQRRNACGGTRPNV